ncbi:MAG: alpha/beta fold hydrolase [Anaerolineae bacterium]|nr:alpha/beta fold hydrolase [Anaerolineae bacterium]MCX8066620.1 alpha/beta fold hydrolase [Anaerolineae bacterium]
MTRHPHLDPSPFLLEGGPVGVLLIHGFTGSPPEMRLVGDYLHARGMTVYAPLLPGHGTTVEEMNRCRWTDWAQHVERAFADLRARCRTVFVGGLSMGSLLTLYLAARHPDLPGAVLYSPATLVADRLIYLTPIAKHFISRRPKSPEKDLADPQADLRIWSYEEYPVRAAHELLKLIYHVRRRLSRVTCPLLIFYGTRDRAIHPRSAFYTYERVRSTEKELVVLHNSGHCLTVDAEWVTVAEKTWAFLQAHLP